MDWKPSSPLSVDLDRTLEQAESSMPVRLIATFDGLKTAAPEASVSQALEIANKGDLTTSLFDVMPIVQSSDFLTDCRSKAKISWSAKSTIRLDQPI